PAQMVGERERGLAGGVRPYYQELFATPAGEDVVVFAGLAQSCRDLCQHAVADGVAVGVVDRLEPVDVDQQQRVAAFARGRRRRQRLDQARALAPVVQPGQRVGRALGGEL